MILAGSIAFAILVAGWFGYPIVLALVAHAMPRRAHRPAAAVGGDPVTGVSIVIATREPLETLDERLDDLVRQQADGLDVEVVLAVDPGAALPLERYRAALGHRATVVQGDQPGGKATTLNAGVRAARHPLLLLTDSRQTFAPDAVQRLVRFLDDPRFGAVTGGYESASHDGIMGLVWRYEQSLRRLESSTHSVVAVTGAIYAMRRSLWPTLPAGLICDDLLVPMHVIASGHRVGYCESARAHDHRRFTRDQDFARKVRTLTGMLQFCAWRPGFLLPWRNPVWAQFVCHKLLRIATPYLTLLVVVAFAWAAIERFGPIPPAAIFALLAVALLAALGTLLLAPARRLAAHLAWALRLQGAPVLATLHAVRGRWDVWKTH